MKSRIFLIGYMGSGKSTIGPMLAKKTAKTFFDLDREIEKKEGRAVAEIFETRGEEYFRRVETEVLKTIVCQNDYFVLSAGGGTPCFNGNMEWMNRNGMTVYIDLPVKSLAHRLLSAKIKRPLLTHLAPGELETFITAQLDQRMEFYRQAEIIYYPLSSNLEQLVLEMER